MKPICFILKYSVDKNTPTWPFNAPRGQRQQRALRKKLDHFKTCIFKKINE